MPRYYNVLVASALYHGAEPLTYSADGPLTAGQAVSVPLQRQAVLGVVAGPATRPRFKTRAIAETFELPPLPPELPQLAEWLGAYYPAPLGIVGQLLLPSGLSTKSISSFKASMQPEPSPVPLLNQPPLTADQAAALRQLQAPGTALLHGDTGTGKTRVYIERAQQAMAAGRSSIILTPEIGLTSQLAASVRQVFGDRVVVAHSQLTPKARVAAWLEILLRGSREPLIVLGPRSALFSPLPRLGLIVVDECHEPAYKQEQAPHYQAVRVASQLAALHDCSLVLGSATPAITDYYIAQQKHKPVVRMRQPAAGANDGLVATTLVDLKDRDQFTRSQHLSTPLLKAIEAALQGGRQSLLYLNRRGTARVILCNNCGWQAACPHCDLPLTYHHDSYNLQCHSCGYARGVPTSCPDCGNTDIVFRVVGTKAVEAELMRLFPAARVMRFDTDNKRAERFEQHYEAVKAGEVDILVGTQLLAKGLDLPRLVTLGVVVADTSLAFPDYSAEERTYQLLNQVAGRVGRGHLDSQGQPIRQQLVVQSYDPSRPVISAALGLNGQDWASFYDDQIAQRQAFTFPPFCYLLKLSCRRASSSGAEKACHQFAAALTALRLPLIIEGPMPSFHSRINDKYEWQLVVKSKQRPALIQAIALLKTEGKSGWSYDIDPVNLL